MLIFLIFEFNLLYFVLLAPDEEDAAPPPFVERI
jgi:hypothetical protein